MASGRTDWGSRMTKSSYVAITVALAITVAACVFIFQWKGDGAVRPDDSATATGPGREPVEPAAAADPGAMARPSGDIPPMPAVADLYTPAQAYAAASDLLSCSQLEGEFPLPPGSTDAEVAEIIRSREILRAECNRGLDTSHSMYDLAKFAAEAGDVDAQVNFSLFASMHFARQEDTPDPATVQEFRQDTMRYLGKAAASGSVDALQRLAIAHEEGTYGGADPVKAYAYARAFASRHPSGLSLDNLRRLERELSAEQVRIANVHADHILETFDNH